MIHYLLQSMVASLRASFRASLSKRIQTFLHLNWKPKKIALDKIVIRFNFKN